MKKCVSLLLALSLFSCANEEPIKLDSQSSPDDAIASGIDINRRSGEEAIALAKAMTNQLYPQSAVSRSSDVTVSLEAITTPNSRGTDADTLIYVVNYEDNQGYVLVSAPRHATPILAVVDKGNYNPETGSDNPGLNFFLDAAREYVASTNSGNISIGGDTIPRKPDPDDMHPAFDGYTEIVTHWGSPDNWHLRSQWGQKNIYGQFCPNKIAGCAPVAIGSILAYFNFREENANGSMNYKMNYTFPERDIDSEIIDWIEVYRHWSIYYPYLYKLPDGTTELREIEEVCWAHDKESTHNTIGRLLRQIGVMCKTDHSKPNESSTKKSNAKKAIEKLFPGLMISGYNKFDSKTVMRSIDYGLLFMAGSDHAWVADGYEYIKWHSYNAEWDYTNKKWINQTNKYWESSLTHFRWGWYGVDDGFFEGNVFNAQGHTFKDLEYIAIMYNH